MALLVHKYGGTSVATIERIQHVAEKICTTRRSGYDLIVVVSAMAGETNRLLALAHQITETPDEREKDVLLASGEQVSIALLTLALKALGQTARSFLGHQVRIATDNAFGKARILTALAGVVTVRQQR
jgi:aspartate kinase